MYFLFLIISIEEMPRKSKVTNETLNMDDDKPIEEVVKKEKKHNPWIVHCMKVKQENPNVAYRDILKMAKETYKK